jgi:bifunctional oligoribonuclease and PAP phosphatase NrnA
MLTFPDQDIETLRSWLSENNPITIITHYNPDGDAIGSAIGLKLFLEKYDYEVDCIFPSEYPPYYNWMPGVESGLIYKEQNKISFAPYFEANRLIFCLDFNHSSRVNQLSELLANSPSRKILIDHHEEPSDEFQLNFSYPGRSSTCELIYELIMKYDKGKLDLDISTCLYTGLITDTGGFQFSSTHSSTHQMAAHLIEIGIQPSDIYNHSFNNFSLNRLKLFGHCIANNMKIFEEKKLAYIWIDRKTKEEFDIKDGDTEGLVNYPLKVMGIDVAVLFKQDYDKIRISFRSKNDVDVSKFSKSYFNGGGHKNAAGGMSKLRLKETLEYFEGLIDKL